MTDAEARAELREQLTEAFANANYPVKNQMELVPALPNGPGTKFEAEGVSFTAMELAAKLGPHAEFPYDDVDSLVEDVMAALRDEGMV